MTLIGVILLLSNLAPSCSAGSPPVPLSTGTIQDPYQLVRGAAPPPPELAKVPWYPEFLEYKVQWGLVSVGSANLGTTVVEDFNGNPAVRIVSQAYSNKFCDSFYKVRDLNESWIDAAHFYSLGYSKKVREGHFYRNEWVLYDYPHKTFICKTTNKSGESSFKQGSIPGPVQDILSSLYFIRTSPLQVGDEIILDANTKENWPLVIKVLSKQTISVPAGNFDAVVVQPFLRKEGIFIQKGKRLQVWMTSDSRHLPVFMSVEVFFGHVTARLVRINGNPAPLSELPN